MVGCDSLVIVVLAWDAVISHAEGSGHCGSKRRGKSTTASAILRDALRVREFVNADTIAEGLRELARLRKRYWGGRWRKRKRYAEVRLSDGTLARRSAATDALVSLAKYRRRWVEKSPFWQRCERPSTSPCYREPSKATTPTPVPAIRPTTITYRAETLVKSIVRARSSAG